MLYRAQCLQLTVLRYILKMCEEAKSHVKCSYHTQNNKVSGRKLWEVMDMFTVFMVKILNTFHVNVVLMATKKVDKNI